MESLGVPSNPFLLRGKFAWKRRRPDHEAEALGCGRGISERDDRFVSAIDDRSSRPELLGGKAASLARLAAAGFPVPRGFSVTTEAYRRFVADHAIESKIQEAVASTGADVASRRIAGIFADHGLPEEISIAIVRAYRRLGGGNLRVAVRSSATAEDLEGISAAGQQETYLNVQGVEDVLDAVRLCWASLWTARAISYRANRGVSSRGLALAVVVQEMVEADVAGVLFTADPLTGARDRIVINASWGLAEAVVSGKVSPDTFIVARASGKLIGAEVREKLVWTVPDPLGTREEPVPATRRDKASLSPSQAEALARLGARIERTYGRSMDVEWAIRGAKISILQARPITSFHGHDPDLGEWNDSLAGDFLWTNGNFGEAIPDVMTACTWSLVRRFIDEAMSALSVPGLPLVGNIGGRFYMNLSAAATIASALGMKRRFSAIREQLFGGLPEGLDTPLIAVSRWRLIGQLMARGLRAGRRVRACRQRRSAFLAEAPGLCERLRGRIRGTSDPSVLVRIWEAEIDPFLREACQMLEAAGRQDGCALVMLRWKLSKLVGEADASALLTGLGDGPDAIASFGPLIGLAQLARGEIDRETFLLRHGHRGPHEFELSVPRPAEDPDWIETQLAGLRSADEEIDAMLARQEVARNAAWKRLRSRFPRKEASIRRRIARWAASARDREAARSEVVRVSWVLREFVLKAGAISGLDQAIFNLTIDEILGLLGGDRRPIAGLPARQAARDRQLALPPLPALIRGSFDPLQWASDPDRRTDVYDSRGRCAPSGDAISGSPGASGVVEGFVRVLLDAESGDQLQAGEILVTTATNVGWTPLFPRALAIVTDVGAPLSHAVIVARELGIPAVVGCGNATMRLRTGDRVRVDGAGGTVELLEAAEIVSGSTCLISGG